MHTIQVQGFQINVTIVTNEFKDMHALVQNEMNHQVDLKQSIVKRVTPC